MRLCKREQNMGEAGIIGRLQPTGSGRVTSTQTVLRIFEQNFTQGLPLAEDRGDGTKAMLKVHQAAMLSRQINVCLIINAKDTPHRESPIHIAQVRSFLCGVYTPKEISSLSDLKQLVSFLYQFKICCRTIQTKY